MGICYITDNECEFYEDDECLAVFESQCPIANMTDEELWQKVQEAEDERTI